MKRAEALALGIKQATLDEQEIDITRAVVSEEFGRKSRGDSYRERAITRLVALGVPWHAEWNITHESIQRYVKVICPYCQSLMEPKKGGGNSSEQHVEFRCGCGASVGLTVPASGALTFSPPRKEG